MLKKDEMPDHLRTRIWNVFYECIFKKAEGEIENYFDDSNLKFIRVLWDKFFKGNLWDFDRLGSVYKVMKTKETYEKLQWFEIYDLIEFVLSKMQVRHTKNLVWGRIGIVLEEERTSYRIIKDLVVPLTSEEEIKEIEKVFNMPDKYSSVGDHFEKALKLFSMRPEADYENSIKESISAVDLLVQIILGKEGTLGKLVDGLDIHPALKKAFSNLYGWTSDDAGIRHPKSKEPLSCDEPEARYMLITCSAFINYVIAKCGGGVTS